MASEKRCRWGKKKKTGGGRKTIKQKGSETYHCVNIYTWICQVEVKGGYVVEGGVQTLF
jgi:hypothetical protein